MLREGSSGTGAVFALEYHGTKKVGNRLPAANDSSEEMIATDKAAERCIVSVAQFTHKAVDY